MTGNPRDVAPRRAGRKQPSEADGAGLTGAQVAGYLRRHPNFLLEHPELLDVLTPPRRDCGEGVIDLQHFMVERLRHDVAEMAAARDALVCVGRNNMAAQSRVHRAVLALLAAQSFEHLIETVTTDLAVMLDLDAVTLGVEQATDELPPARLGGVYQLEPDTVDALIGAGRAVHLRAEVEGDPAIFGAAAGLIGSQALIRLCISDRTPPAMLALGSRQPEQFHPGQGTELMGFLGQALQLCIRRWLDLPD